jgi:hypothetical protein
MLFIFVAWPSKKDKRTYCADIEKFGEMTFDRGDRELKVSDSCGVINRKVESLIQPSRSLMHRRDAGNDSDFCARVKADIGSVRIGLMAAQGTTGANRKPIRFVRPSIGTRSAAPLTRFS